MLSRRAQCETEENALTQALLRRRRSGEPILDLTVSDPTKAGLTLAPDALLALSGPASCVYDAAPFGLREARETVATMLGCSASNVALTASTSEAYGYLLTLLCDPGDHVLVPRPSYPLLEVLARHAGVRVTFYDFAYDGRWHIDTASLERASRVPIKLVFVVSPNNPTGAYLDAEDLARLAAIGAPVVVDEVFAAYPLEGRPSVRTLDATTGLVISLGGLSKLACLPQMKLAWMAFAGDPSAVHTAMAGLEHVADAYLGLSTPVQHALAALLEAGASLRTRLRARLAENLRAIDDAICGTALTRLHVDAGWYVILRPPSVIDESAWALALLDAGVLVQPGYFYDFAESPRLVVSLLTPPETLREGMRMLTAVVEKTIG